MKTNEKTKTDRLTSLRNGMQMNPQKIARVTGVLFLITYITSIPAFFGFYAPVLENPRYIAGAGADKSVSLGAFLELILIIPNIGTAVALWPALTRQGGRRQGRVLGRVLGAEPPHPEHRHRRRAVARPQAAERDPRPWIRHSSCR